MTNTIEILETEISNYSGFTIGLSHLNEWVPENGSLDTLIAKFSEKSLDIKPFLHQIELLK